jgi:hypothetical protein
MEIRRAIPDDYPGICELAAANYEQNLSPTDRQQGFISAKYTLQQIADIASDLGIIVARDNDRVVGFACASRLNSDDQPSIVKNMIAEFDRIGFQGRLLADYKIFLYGPACLGLAYRGRGLLRELYQGIKREVTGKYDLGSAFIDEDNPRSLKAHAKSLGMSEVGRFAHDERSYRMLVFRVEADDEMHA